MLHLSAVTVALEGHFAVTIGGHRGEERQGVGGVGGGSGGVYDLALLVVLLNGCLSAIDSLVVGSRLPSTKPRPRSEDAFAVPALRRMTSPFAMIQICSDSWNRLICCPAATANPDSATLPARPPLP